MLRLVLLATLCSAKFVSTALSLSSEEGWKYVTKFAAKMGKSHWEMKAKLMKPIESSSTESMDFEGTIYIDKKWKNALEAQGCEEKELSSKKQSTLSVPLNGEWSNTIEGSLISNMRTHFWYFAISNCELSERYKLRIEMKIINSDGSEFSAEEAYLEYIYLVLLIVSLVGLSGNMHRLISKFKQTDDLENNLLILNISIACTFIGILFEVIHIWVYAYNGKGVVVLDVFYQVFEVLSSILISILLIIIASGWTLKFKEFPDADIYVPISLFVVVLNLMIVGLGRITEDTYYKNSDYESLPGYCLVVMRVILWAWFVYLVRDLQNGASLKLQNFLFRFNFMASAYFLALPGVVLFSWVFEPYVRNQVVIISVNLIQIVVFAFLTHLFSEKSTFYKISTMSDSVLPGKYQ
jgi:hypothetical protein